MRILFLITTLMSALFIGGCKAAPPSPIGQIVQTTTGPVKGLTEDFGISYRGIPYAASTAGEMRWTLPKPRANWSKPFDASAFGAACPQDKGGKDDWIMDEDCLVINVYTPKGTTDVSNLPVLLWYHGGGLRGGRGDVDGAALASKGMVVVSLNYRLGRLGFMDWAGWNKDDVRNFGMADMVAGLDWVQDNIGSFGGDKDNVTIAGHSAGGMAVQLMMVAPDARGKFARAMSHAGYSTWPCPPAMNPSAQMRTRMKYSSLENLKKQSVDSLVGQTPHFILPYIGGSDLPLQPAEYFKSGEQARVPYMSGGNSYDGAGVLFGAGFSVENYLEVWAAHGDKIKALYAEDFAVNDGQAAQRLFGDHRYIQAARLTTREMKNVNQPGYLFYFAQTNEGQPGAYHGQEMGQAWGRDETPLQTYWLCFIKTGTPNCDDSLADWTAYNKADDNWMVFTHDAPDMQSGVLREKLDLIEGVEGLVWP
ncbi:MAG: carboxylesterase family protein [Robiginitomaculum sp.]